MPKYAISTILAMLHLLMIICANTKSLNSSTDEHALLAFKAQITYDPSNLLAKNWSQGTSFCDWIGVTCSTRHQQVRVLNLANMGLSGSIPIEIGNLSKLQNLNLTANNLTGALPSTIFNISSLLQLRLKGNKISGEFPKDPCRKPTKLEVLDLDYNNFHGEIPSTLLQCRALKELRLNSNGFTGSIPMGIGNLSALQWLTLYKNSFRGSISHGIGNLSSLQHLDLGSNMLTGSIPYGIGNLSSLQYLYLDSNMLTEYGSTGLISTMADVYSYGIVLMETFTRKKPTDDMFVGEFTMRRWVFESFTDGITQIVDMDLVNVVEDNIRARENCLRSIMGLALECTTDLPEERLDMKDVLTRLRKIKFEFCK